jgi:hypothetical protein
LPALGLLRKPLYGLAKRHIQPERYAKRALKFPESIGAPPSMAAQKRFSEICGFVNPNA